MIPVVHPEAEYAAFLGEGRFMIQRAAKSGRHLFFPRVMEPGTGDSDLSWVEASGRGTIYSFTIVRNRPPADHYVIALIDLAERVRMMSRVVDCDPSDIAIGMAVRAQVAEVEGAPAVLFAPATASGHDE